MAIKLYDGPVPRPTARAARLLPVLGVAVLLTACGAPPQPLPTAPPETFGNPGSVPSGAGYPSAGVPTYQLPSGALPTAGYPTYPLPGNPTVPAPGLTTAPVSPPTTGPPPAPKCTKGPTGVQIIAVVKGKPGIPANKQLVVRDGPYCAGSWQYSGLGPPGTGTDYDALLVVTTGRPSALTLVEAGTDVCSDRVQSDAPVGIRVWACGS